MTLKEHIDDICQRLTEKEFTLERNVSDTIVRRLLGALGWPVLEDPKVVFPEYPVRGGRVDIALCHPPSKPQIFIEVKQVGQIDEEAEDQLFGYLSRKIVEIAILTDGREWHFFNPRGLGDHDERKVCQLNLVETYLEESVERLSRYLDYKAICTGSAIKAFQDDHQDVIMQRQIEEIWNKLLEQESMLLTEPIMNEVKNVHGQKPVSNQVLDFLNCLEKIDPHIPLQPPLDKPSIPTDKKPYTRLAVTMPDGKRINHNKSVDTYVEAIEILGLDRVEKVKPKILSTSRTYQDYRKRGQYYININLSNDQKKIKLEKVAEALGVPLKVNIVPKN